MGKKVIDVLRANPGGLSVSEISKKTGLDKKIVKKKLDELVKKRLLGQKSASLGKKAQKNVKKADNKVLKKKLEGLKNKADVIKKPKKIVKNKIVLEKKKALKKSVKKKTFKALKKKPLTKKPSKPQKLVNKSKQAKPEKQAIKSKVLKSTKKSVGRAIVKSKINDETFAIKRKQISRRKPIPRKDGKIDVAAIDNEIREEQIKKQRPESLTNIDISTNQNNNSGNLNRSGKAYVKTGVEGFDELLFDGIPRGNAMLVAGGAGSGKTIFCLQTLVHQAMKGKKCLIMSLEEREDRLIQHMEDFGWPAKKLVKKGNLRIQRINPFDITRNVDALLAKQKGELLIKVDPVILPRDFKNPDFIAIDSLTAISSAFTGKDESYRIYIEQLFRFLENSSATSFLITETEQVPKIFSPTGVEEFLADGVVVMYALKHGNVRENAIEILKLRGASHQKKIVAMQVTGQGIVVYPEQEVFSDID